MKIIDSLGGKDSNLLSDTTQKYTEVKDSVQNRNSLKNPKFNAGNQTFYVNTSMENVVIICVMQIAKITTVIACFSPEKDKSESSENFCSIKF